MAREMTCCTHSESGAFDRDADRSIIVPSETHPPHNERAPPSTAKLMILPLQPMGTPTRQAYQLIVVTQRQIPWQCQVCANTGHHIASFCSRQRGSVVPGAKPAKRTGFGHFRY